MGIPGAPTSHFVPLAQPTPEKEEQVVAMAAALAATGDVAAAQPSPPPRSADPCDVTLEDLATALRTPLSGSWRAFRLLSRLHVSLLRLLIDDRDDLLERDVEEDEEDAAAAEEAGDGGGDDDDDDDQRGAAAQPRRRRGALKAGSAKLERSAIPEMYDQAMTPREWDVEVALPQVSPLTWPEVLRRAISSGPIGLGMRALLTPAARAAAARLGTTE